MDPSLCANGCGFYGSAANKNLCSKCYNDYLKENITKSYDEGLKIETKNLKDETLVLESSTSSKNPVAEVCDDMADVSLTESENMKNKKKRCKSCNKKVGLIGFNCRCGDVFCGRHRYPETHACEKDLKEIGRQALAKQNPLINSDKLEYRI